MVKKLISLLLISVCLGDTLILKDKTEYTGALMKFGINEIIFKALPSAKLSINISDIQELKLSDGTKVFENGIIVTSNEKNIKSKIQAEKAKQKRKYKELFINNTKHNGFRKRNSVTQKSIQNSTLTLKDKSVYTGDLIKYGNDEIIFKPLPPSAKLSVNIKDILELRLSDGTNIFENGILIEPEEQLRKYIKMGNMKENSKYIINCCILILILGYIAFLSTDIDLGGTSGPWPGDGATVDS